MQSAIKELLAHEIDLDLHTLPRSDYVVSNRIMVNIVLLESSIVFVYFFQITIKSLLFEVNTFYCLNNMLRCLIIRTF